MKRAFQNLFRKGEGNPIKIVCLGVGLAIGLVMLAEVIFERSYDNFIPRLEDTYQIQSAYASSTDLSEHKQRNYSSVSGAIAPGIKTYCPEVEAATRYTELNYEMKLVTEDQRMIQGNAFFCDSAFFDVFPRDLLVGEDPHTGLEKANQAYISSEMSEKLGGEIVGKTLYWKEFPQFRLTVAGVFEAFPENTHLPKMDMLVAMPTIGQVSWDGRNNWVGNDRYAGYIRLAPGTDPKVLAPGVEHMMDVHGITESIRQAGGTLKYSFQPVEELFTASDYNRIMNLVFLGFGIIMLMVAVLNYILLVVSSLVNRAKSIATYRCYGAGNKEIYRMIFAESGLHCFLSLILAVLIVFGLQDFLQGQIGHSLSSLFPPATLVVCLGVTLAVAAACGLLPGYFYTRIPVTYAYRRYTEHKRLWKLGLLFVQFLLTSLFVCLLTVIGLQYHNLTHFQTGFEYRNVVYVSLPGTKPVERERCVQELKKLPNVSGVTWGYQEMFLTCSGNNVFMEGEDRQLFNVADMYLVGPDYHRTFEIPVIEGRTFTPHLRDSLTQEVMVSRSFVEKMKQLGIWKDSPIGKTFCITEHQGQARICGVYENIQLGSQVAEKYDSRPTVMFYGNEPNHQLYIRLKETGSRQMEEIQRVITETMPSQDKKVYSLNMDMENLYNGVLHIRNSVLFAGICILLIALIGLTAYVRDEVNRRRSEIAIRMIHGAGIGNVERLFLGDLLKTALPAILTGGMVAYLLSRQMLELFATKIDLTAGLFGGCMLAVLGCILALAAGLIRKAAQTNPTINLRTE